MVSKNERSFELRLGKIGVILLIAGMGCLVFSAFFLGVTVGKDIDSYPDKIVRGIPRDLLERIGLLTAPAKTGVEGNKVKENETLGLTFYDTLTKKGAAKGELINEENKGQPGIPAVIMAPAAPLKQAAQGVTAPASSPPAVAPLPSVKAPEGKEGKDGKADKSPALSSPILRKEAGKTAAAAPPAVKEDKTKASGSFAIQVVSYNDRDKANQLKKKLNGLGYKADISETDISGKGKWYRVVVNGYHSKQEAEKTAARMSEKVKGLNCVVRQQEH